MSEPMAVALLFIFVVRLGSFIWVRYFDTHDRAACVVCQQRQP